MDVRNIDIKTSTYKNCKQLDPGCLVFASACFTHVHLVIRTLINKHSPRSTFAFVFIHFFFKFHHCFIFIICLYYIFDFNHNRLRIEIFTKGINQISETKKPKNLYHPPIYFNLSPAFGAGRLLTPSTAAFQMKIAAAEWRMQIPII